MVTHEELLIEMMDGIDLILNRVRDTLIEVEHG